MVFDSFHERRDTVSRIKELCISRGFVISQNRLLKVHRWSTVRTMICDFYIDPQFICFRNGSTLQVRLPSDFVAIFLLFSWTCLSSTLFFHCVSTVYLLSNGFSEYHPFLALILMLLMYSLTIVEEVTQGRRKRRVPLTGSIREKREDVQS